MSVFFIIVAGLILLGITSAIETLVLMRLRWSSPGNTFYDALTANLASVLLLALVAPRFRGVVNTIPLFFVVAGFCLGAALIEGAILRLLRGRPLGRCYLSALAANAASFFFVLAATIGLLLA